MSRHNEKKKNIVPPADIILNMLNEKPGADLDLLDFYKGYIRRASIEPSYSEEGFDKGKHINEDLRQEIEIAFLKGLVSLRHNICKKGSTVLFIVPSKSWFD